MKIIYFVYELLIYDFPFSQLYYILEMNPKGGAEENGANIDLDSQGKGKCVVLKTSTRQVSNLFSAHQGHVFYYFFVFPYIICSPLSKSIFFYFSGQLSARNL
jgi:hypothetical protein